MKAREWTTGEEARLRDLWNAGTTMAEMCSQLGRTPMAIYCRRDRMKLAKRCVKWTPGQKRIAERLADNVMNQLAERTGNSPWSCSNALIESLMKFGKRQRRQSIDVGGMRDVSLVHSARRNKDAA